MDHEMRAGMTLRAAVFACCASLLGACAMQQPLAFEHAVLDRPLPDDTREQSRQCLAIRWEIARREPLRLPLSIKQPPGPRADPAQGDKPEEIAILQQRASSIGCYSKRRSLATINVVPPVGAQ